MQNKNSKPAIVGVGTFMAASLGVTLSASLDEDADNLFLAESIDDIDILSAEDDDAKCGEGQCGEDDDGDGDDAKCGEGQCGEDGDDEGECGEGECGEGQCGEDDDSDSDDDDAEAKCGEGQCGGDG